MLDTIWANVSDIAAEIDEARPREASRRLVAAEDGRSTMVTLTPGRLDIVESPGEPMSGVGVMPLVHIGPAASRLPIFSQKIAERLIPNLDQNISILRVAVGMMLLRDAADRTAAYAEIQQLVDVQTDWANARDFVLQLNHPSESTLDGATFELNRLRKWAVLRVAQFAVQVRLGISQADLASEKYFVSCEVDNSTAVDRKTPIPRTALGPVFFDLLRLAEVTARGERNA